MNLLTGMVEGLGDQRYVLFHRDTRGSRILEGVKLVDGETDVVEELVGHVAAESLLAEYAHHNDVLDVGGECVGRYHPSLLGEFVLEVEEGPLGGLLCRYLTRARSTTLTAEL